MPTPHSKSRSAFDRFAPTLGTVLKQFPTPVTLNPHPLSCETFAQRFRDAISAKRAYGYKSAFVDEALFTTHSEAIVVRMRADGNIVIGSRETSKTDNGKSFTVLGHDSHETTIEVEAPNTVELVTLCSLLSRRALKPAVQFKVAKTTLIDQQIHPLENAFDVAFVDSEPGYYTIS